MQTFIYTLHCQATAANTFALLEYISQHPSADALLTSPERKEIDDLLRAALPGSLLGCDSDLEIDPRFVNPIA